MNEKEFWTAYFSSKYFHRNRVSLASDKDDLFQPYMADEQTCIRINVDVSNWSNYRAKNKLVDLSLTSEDVIDKGNGPDASMMPGKVKEALPLIRMFNRHSDIILNSSGYPLLI